MEEQSIPEQTPRPIPEEGLPGILGALTVLTMIGSAFSVIGSLLTPLGCKVLMMEEVIDKMKPKDVALLEATCEHRNVLMLGGILGGVLCFVGALMMRRLKMQGFVVYIVGQILPIILTAIVMAELMFADPKNWIGYGITCFFIGLYATQRKHLVR
jgi:hypothetical protein